MTLLQIEKTAATDDSLPLLRLGFRPFFLLAGISAIVLILSWLYLFNAGAGETLYGAISWHAHEMLFGFAVAVIAGFLLTAAKNWTSVQTLHGVWLGILALVWLAGRVAPWLPLPGWLIGVIDLGFLPLLALTILLPIVKTSQYQHLIFVLILLVLFAANLLFHLGHISQGWHSADLGIRLAWLSIVFLITVMGGRVIPFFIERGTGMREKVRTSRLIEITSIATLLAWMLAVLLASDHRYVAYLACVAGLFQLLRWWNWHLGALWRVPMLWILYLGYAWIPVGLFLYAYAVFVGMIVSPALHAFTAGTIGMLTLGMMARVSLGHTGREIQANSMVIAAFVLVTLASLVRVIGSFLATAFSLNHYAAIITSAGILWAAGFLLFVVTFFSILTRPRIDMRPG
jgi:uncharacterized protein involved in response to NO